MKDTVYRKPYGQGFTYQDTAGRTIKDKAVRRWIESLAIPPAWEEVEINLDRSAKVHVVGRDNKGRKQYIYNSRWTDSAQRDKYNRIVRFARQLETMRRVTGQHIKQRPINRTSVLACMTRMLDEAFFRPGSSTYTRNNGTYGLTTLRSKHISFTKNRVEFHYIGKSHQEQHREVQDTHVKAVLKQLDRMPGYELFDITDEQSTRTKLTANDLNDYIASVMGEDFSAKDFRTWAGTLLMAIVLDELGPTPDQKTAHSNIVAAIKTVAEDLGNTPAITRENYVHPEIITQYQSGRSLDYFRKQLKNHSSQYTSLDEAAALKLLEHVVEK